MIKKRNKIFYAFGIILVLILSATLSGAIKTSMNIKENKNLLSNLYAETQMTSAKWTVMMYLACDTFYRHKLIDFYIDILTNIGSNTDFKIVALIDGLDKGDTSYYYIEKDLPIPLEWYSDESNMADPETFENFIRLSKYLYPADHYALFTLSDYGSGWQGIFSDTNGGDGMGSLSMITMPEVSDTLLKVTDNGTNKIDVYGIDVCIPGTVEVAYEIAPYVKYMVANQEHGHEGYISDEGFEIGWNYSYYLRQLKENPDMKPELFAKLIANSFRPGTYTSKILGEKSAPKWYPISVFYVTLSAINLSKIDIIKNAISNLALNLSENLEDIKDDIKTSRSKTREYGKLYRKFWWIPPRVYFALKLEPFGYDCFIDLYDFVEKLKDETGNQEIKNSCKNVMEALNTTVIANKALPTDPSHGLSIYFPELRCQYDQSIWRMIGDKNFRKIPSSYDDLKFSKDTLWDEFLVAYLKIRK